MKKKYVNAGKILPESLIKEIQKYVQGSYLYIPKAERTAWGNNTGIRAELHQRNERIKQRYQDGTDISILAEVYCLSEERIRAIIYGYVDPGSKKKEEAVQLPEEQPIDKQQAKALFEDFAQRNGLPLQYVDAGYSASFATNERTLTFFFRAPKLDEQRQPIDYQPLAKHLADRYKSRIQLKQTGGLASQ